MPVGLSLTRRNAWKPWISTPFTQTNVGCMPMENLPLQVNGVLEYSVMLAMMEC